MTSGDIADLLTRVALRDRAAFETLYHRTSPKLFGVCLHILQDRADAEDALQETYARIWRNASKYESLGYSPISWLVAVARNHAIDRLRAQDPQPVELDAAEIAADDALDPAQAAEAFFEWRSLEYCLETLDEVRAQAVRSAYMEGYSYQELAARYTVPLNTMRTWLRRSLIKLRECLEP